LPSNWELGGYKLPLHVSCGASILGHILYASAYRANYLYLILIGRIVSGFAFSLFMYCKRYCSDPRIVGVRRRTTLASWLVMGQGLGMSIGPFAGGLLYKIGFRNSIFNGFTSPGWIMAAVWSVFWVLVVFFYEDIPTDRTPPVSIPASDVPTNEKDRSKDPTIPPLPASSPQYWMSYAQCGVAVCMCWFAMTSFFILGAWESNLPVFGADMPQLHWSPFTAGNFIALGGITALPFLIVNIVLAGRTQDRHILAFGSSLGFSALLVFLSLLRSQKVNYGSVFMCWWGAALGFNLASTVTISMLSKQLPPSWNNRTSLVIQYSNYAGRVTGAIWGGAGVHVGMMNYVGLEIALTGIGGILLIILWHDLKTTVG
jgi:MFS family permease